MDTQIRVKQVGRVEIIDRKANLSHSNTVIGLLDNIFQWGIDRKITKDNGATAQSQMKKLLEEIDEIQEGLNEDNLEKVADGIGDAYVVLQQIARLAGIPMETCFRMAWNSIKDRTGQMRHGVFVKQADIDLIGEDALRRTGSAEELRSLIALAKDTQGE